MAHVSVREGAPELDEPLLVEGLPGVGLVGKIAADHLVQTYDMPTYATVHCEGVPDVAVYGEGERGVSQPVRLHADPERDLLVLQSDVPVSPQSAGEFAGCVTGWLDGEGVTPIYLSGLPTEAEGAHSIYGVGTGTGGELLDETDVGPPAEGGAISGPTGALLSAADRTGLDAVGLIAEADASFPDPEAARVLLREGIEPIAGVDVDTDRLVDQAEEIGRAKERLARQMQQADQASTRAGPLGMYQ
jgi:uncharacterized protein